MSLRGAVVLASSVLIACGGDSEPPPPPPAAPTPVVEQPPTAAEASAGITELPTFDPGSDAHLDRDGRDTQAPAAPPRPRGRSGRTLGITLRSTPNGAMAAVDGIPVGPTPTYWEGEFTGAEREFTFALAGHAVARYRFTPITGGVVFGRLEPIAVRPGAALPAIPPPSTPAQRSTAAPRPAAGSAPLEPADPAPSATAPSPPDATEPARLDAPRAEPALPTPDPAADASPAAAPAPTASAPDATPPPAPR
jgi:hypothetical protein